MRADRLMIPALVLLLGACAQGPQEEATIGFEEEPAAELPASVGLVDEGPDEHLLYPAGTIEWVPAPPSLERGAEVAVLEGDPAEAGIFTMRIRMPDGFVIAPHSHPNVERVTVVAGTFLLGSGEEVDAGAAETLETGSYTAIPPGTTHHAIAEGETVIQLTSVGPWVLEYADPADDPRNRQ